MPYRKILVVILSLFTFDLLAQPSSKPKAGDTTKELYLFGTFDHGKIPSLVATCLLSVNEPDLISSWFPNPHPKNGQKDFERKNGGRVRVTSRSGNVVEASWDRVGSYQFFAPAGSELLGWGWLAVVPYIENANAYELFQNDVSIGGQIFGPSQQWEVPHCVITRTMTASPFQSAPNDVINLQEKPTPETLVSITQPNFQSTHGVSGLWRMVGESQWKPI